MIMIITIAPLNDVRSRPDPMQRDATQRNATGHVTHAKVCAKTEH